MNSDKKKDVVFRKAFFWTTVVFAVYFFFKSFGIWWVTFLIIVAWGGSVYVMRKFTFDRRFNWVVVISLVFVVIIFSLLIIPSKENVEKNGVKVQKNLVQYDGKVYVIASNENGVVGTAAVSIGEGMRPIRVQYNVHIADTFPMNKKCTEGPYRTDKNCRWIDFYNYAAAISAGKMGDASVTGITQFYPVFCDAIVTSGDAQKSLTGEYVNCWFGKGSTPKETNMYYWGGVASYESIDDFLKHDTLKVYDAAPHTTRTFSLEDNVGTSIEKMDTQAAVESENYIKEYNISFE